MTSWWFMDLGRNWPYKGQLIPRDSKQLTLSKTLMHLTIKVMDRKAWWVAVHGVAKSRTRLSNSTDWLTHPNLVSNCYCLDPYPYLPPSAYLSPREGVKFLKLGLLCSPFAWQRNKATLSFSITLSPYFCLASVHREPIFWQQIEMCVCA